MKSNLVDLFEEREHEDITFKSEMFNLGNLTEKERICLFGEPCKSSKEIFSRINPLLNENAADIELLQRRWRKKTLAETSDEELQVTFLDKMKNHLQKIVISTDNYYKSAWDFCFLIIITYNCMIVCYYVCFEVVDYLQPVDTLIEVVYYIDIFLNFISAYLNPITFDEVTKITEITKNYLKRTFFFLDLISVFPFALIFPFSSSAFAFKLVRIFRLPPIYTMLSKSKIQRVIEAFTVNKSPRERYKILLGFQKAYQLVALVIWSGFLTYILGCFWYLIVSNESDVLSDDNFYHNNQLYKEPMTRRLFICCYFVVTTLTTVGYGDYTPLTRVERILAIFLMVIGIALFTYIMGSFNTLTQSDNPIRAYNQHNNLQKWLTTLTKYIDEGEHLPKDLVQKIDKYFEYFWQNDKLLDLNPKDKYLTRLPKPIRMEIIKHLYDEIYRCFRAFLLIKDHIGSHFYYELAFEFLPIKYEPNNLILEAGEEVHEIFLIQTGEIEISFKYDDIKIRRILKSGFHFGNYNVFSGKASEFTYKALKQVKAFILPKHRFLKLLEKYPAIKADMTSYAFKMIRQTYRAMADTLRNILKKEKGIELNVQEAQEIITEIVEINTKRNTSPFLNSQKDIKEMEDKMTDLEKEVEFMNKKLENLRNYFSENLSLLNDNMERIKRVTDKLTS